MACLQALSGTEAELGVGVSGMRARLEQLGGRLELRARRPGLLVRAVLPLSREHESPRDGHDPATAP
jgi:signal transduction histidine kinase